jgi:steroid delta-isomerase-like uncharacterized protein
LHPQAQRGYFSLVSTDKNEALVRQFIEELWNARHFEVADEIFAEDSVSHQLKSGSELTSAPRDPETMKRHVVEWLKGFPDLHFTIEQILVSKDRVAMQTTMHGTHTGTWLGIPPTGKDAKIRMITIHRLANGKILEDWVLVESMGIFQQLGLLPPTPEIIANAQKTLGEHR